MSELITKDTTARDMATQRTARRRIVGISALAVTLIAAVAFGLGNDNQGWLGVIATIFMYVALVQGWNLLGGYAGYLNLGTAAFFGNGAYTTTILVDSVPLHFATTPLIGGVVAAVAAAVVGVPALRLRGAYFAIFTLILGFVVNALARNLSITGGGMGQFAPILPFTGVTLVRVWYFIFFALAILVSLFIYAAERSRLGDALIAIREDEEAATVLGVKVERLKLACFSIGGFIAGALGGLFAYRVSYIEPDTVVTVAISINVVIMAVVGGLGRWQGPIVGVPFVMILAELLRIGVQRMGDLGFEMRAESNRIVLGLGVIAIALYAKDGIVGIFSKVRRRRIDV
jgi:branched-chain amino acid transport system permease protein